MIYEIKRGNLTAKVDTLGAQLVSLKGENGFEYLWTGDLAYWKGQAPVLFPMVGALREGKTKIDGEWYEMGQHGLARHREFTLAEQGESCISLRLNSDFETKKQYPFEFSLTVTYTLSDKGIETRFTVENIGDKVLPFAVGGHPGFNIPVNESAAFADYTICFPEPETQTCLAIVMGKGLIDPGKTAFELKNEREIPLRHELFYGDALIFEGLRSDTVQVVNKATGKGIEMDFSQFPMLGIWSAKNDGPYVCLEPWTGCATRTDEGDEFEKKKGMTFLPAGGTAEFAFSVKIL
ncbi:MAG: aldose 1-epimerase family protein [Acutalibacter sp.]|nr:aldose 1-epimerase family protein [Acutalibacter sp.]